MSTIVFSINNYYYSSSQGALISQGTSDKLYLPFQQGNNEDNFLHSWRQYNVGQLFLTLTVHLYHPRNFKKVPGPCPHPQIPALIVLRWKIVTNSYKNSSSVSIIQVG